ncbi:recombinase family protein [Aliiglaciecola lipolytica]|uniref:recombinase family protein n=1 Tax=Aliiglaciecola lipolytica TaxID=477689 RepID=UPI001C0A382B|nr:recombinase family protein [Aliiglaciecola lipolytica]MBU2877594.1 recombinase family protein [Aliiglaciecola lipolytica]
MDNKLVSSKSHGQGKQLGYVRVSTVEQNTARQLEGIELDKVFTDKCSGKDKDRPQLHYMLDYMREGDTIHVHDISRMARNLKDLKDLIETINGKDCTIIFHKENLKFTGDHSDHMQTLMLHMLGAVYEFERSMILERQREGIAIAKKAGKFKGRQKSVDREKVLKCLKDGLSIRKTAKELGIATSTVQVIKKEVEKA